MGGICDDHLLSLLRGSVPAISCSAPGKVILCGEHAVVYGKPAIAVPVLEVATKCNIFARPSAPSDEITIVAPNIGLNCKLGCLVESHPIRATLRLVLEHLQIDHLPVCEIRIHSTLPTAAGMGSSASVSVAMIRAVSTFLGHPLDNVEVNSIAFEIEKIHHGSPSGIDNTVITYAKPLFYVRSTPYEFLQVQKPMTLVVANTGIRSSTVQVVGEVKQRASSEPQKYDHLFSKIAEISLTVRKCIETGALDEVGKKLSENHILLQEIGVSCPKLDELVSCALTHGALGAKLSGSGQGGNMIALVDAEQAQNVANELKTAGAVNAVITQVPAEGKK